MEHIPHNEVQPGEGVPQAVPAATEPNPEDVSAQLDWASHVEDRAASGPLPDDVSSTDGDPERPSDPPQIYVASLADYNHGRYHGAWIDANKPLDEIRREIKTLLAQSPVLQAEGETFGDWAIHDYSGFGQIRLDELEDPEFISALAAGVAAHGDTFAAWAELQDSAELRTWADGGTLVTRFSDAYLGSFGSLRAFGEQFIEDMGWQNEIDAALPPEVARYTHVDADALSQDMWFSGDIQVAHTADGLAAIFRTTD